jgi:hypothetical protein
MRIEGRDGASPQYLSAALPQSLTAKARRVGLLLDDVPSWSGCGGERPDALNQVIRIMASDNLSNIPTPPHIRFRHASQKIATFCEAWQCPQKAFADRSKYPTVFYERSDIFLWAE